MNNIAEYPVPSPTGFSVYYFSESWIFGKVSARSPTPKLMIKNSWLLFTNPDEDLRPITIVFVLLKDSPKPIKKASALKHCLLYGAVKVCVEQNFKNESVNHRKCLKRYFVSGLL